MKKLVLACCMSLMVPFFAGAATKANNQAVKKATIKALVKDFYANKAVKEFNSQLLLKTNSILDHVPNNCEEQPSITSCINAICDKIPKYYCDDTSELKEVAAMCANNIDGSCINAACEKIPSYYCDETSELKEIAKSCSGHVSGGCVKTICDRIPKYYCDDLSEIKEINLTCSGLVDPSCVDAVCGKLPKYYCDDLSELKDIVKTCKGD